MVHVCCSFLANQWLITWILCGSSCVRLPYVLFGVNTSRQNQESVVQKGVAATGNKATIHDLGLGNQAAQHMVQTLVH